MAGRGLVAAAAAARHPRELTECDHRDEDQTDHEHARDHVLALFSGVREEPGGHGPSLTNPIGVRTKRARHRGLSGNAAEPADAADPRVSISGVVLGAKRGAR